VHVCKGVGEGWVLSSRGMDGWVKGGLIASFNIYISHVKKIQDEERGNSPIFFCFGNFLL
jgi:hypothetical protein